MDVANLEQFLERLEQRLDTIERKIDNVTTQKQKGFEWLGQLAEQVGSLDAFREEVRASLEPLFGKLENMDDYLRILRHATTDVSRRLEQLETAEQQRQAS